MSWSAWMHNAERSAKDSNNWHVYRGRDVGGKWEYDTRTYPRNRYPTSQSVTDHLLSQATASSSSQQTSRTNTQAANYANYHNAGTLEAQFRHLQLGQPLPYGSYTPYNSGHQGQVPSTTQNVHGYAYPVAPHSQRSQTPMPQYNTYDGHSRNYSQGSVSTQRHPIVADRSFGRGGETGRSIARSKSAVDWIKPSSSSSGHRSSKRDERTSVPELPGYKKVKGKDQRAAFRVGKVFKTWYTDPGSRNTRGEVLRFVVVKPHTRHSICLAFHTYRDRGTTAPGVRARDHLVAYTHSTPPDLQPGEDPIILKRDPVKVTVEDPDEHFKPTCRLNLTELFSIEHNSAIKKIGKVTPTDMARIKQAMFEVQGFTSALPVQEEEDDEEEEA